MRIAHVSDCYLPRTGGIETQVRALALQQRARGDHVVVITATSDGSPSGVGMLDEIPVERISMRLPGDIPVHLRAGVHLRQALLRARPDVVHIHLGVVSPFAWSAVRASTRLGIPTVVTIHCIWGGLARAVYRLCDVAFSWSRWGCQLSAVSQVAADRVERGTRDRQSVVVLPNGIDPGLWPVVQPQAHEDLVVVSVMRLAPRKRLGALVRMVQAANRHLRTAVGGGEQSRPRIRAIIIGDGPLRRRVQARVRRHGWPVTFTGRLDAGQIQAMFAEADLFVQPSVKEAFGLAALEARTCGLPVLVRSQSGSTQFIRDGVEGLLADSDQAMADVLAQVAQDRAVLAGIRRHNSTELPEMTWDGVLDRVDAAYGRAAALTARDRG